MRCNFFLENCHNLHEHRRYSLQFHAKAVENRGERKNAALTRLFYKNFPGILKKLSLPGGVAFLSFIIIQIFCSLLKKQKGRIYSDICMFYMYVSGHPTDDLVRTYFRRAVRLNQSAQLPVGLKKEENNEGYQAQR